MPAWYAVLVMAEKWGKFPWEIDKSVPAIYWIERFNFIRRAEANAAKAEYERSRHG